MILEDIPHNRQSMAFAFCADRCDVIANLPTCIPDSISSGLVGVRIPIPNPGTRSVLGRHHQYPNVSCGLGHNCSVFVA